MKRSTESATGSGRRRGFSLRAKLFAVILSVALVCIVASAVLAYVLSHRQIVHFMREKGLYTSSTPQRSSSEGQQEVGQEGLSTPQPPEQQGQPPPGDFGEPPGPPPPPEAILSFVLAAMLGVVLALVLGIVLAGRISRPLSELTSASRKIAEGDYAERVKLGGGIEVEELGEAFNTLADSLERNEKLRKNMVADIAHELRNPLATLRGQLELIQDGKIPPDRETVDSLMEDAILLSRLVEDLRQLSVVEAGQLELDLVPVEAGELIRSIVSRFEHEAADKGVALSQDLQAGLPRIKADRHRIEQVLGNLVRNSLINTPPGGSIKLSASRRQDDVVFTVADTGAGISPEELPFVFERFHRADKSRARATGGAGLGLSIAKSLVEANGGRIWAESEMGKGTEIHFTIPVY